MRWAFEVERTGLERRNLIELVESLGYKALEVPGHKIILYSDSFEACSTSVEVWEQAKILRDLMACITEIDKKFSVGAVLDMTHKPPKRYVSIEIHSVLQTVTIRIPTLKVLPPVGLSEEQLAEWTERVNEKEYQSKLEAQRAK